MKLTAAEFDALYQADTLKIAFIGMSNIGKSFSAQRIEKLFNFKLVEIDALIFETLGQSTMAEFAAWQGQPYESGYQDRENESVALETKAVNTALDHCQGNTLVDTPGSVVYVEPRTLNRLNSECLIVYIRARTTDLERLKRDYFDTPKPLVWNGHFHADPEKSDIENVMACYPNLLDSRAKAYAKIADITLDAEFILNPETTPDDLWQAIKAGSETNPA